MRQWQVKNDQIWDAGEVAYLGISKQNNTPILPDNYDGWFPFMRMCNSVGDHAITSGLFEALKKKYPKLKIAIPTMDFIKQVQGESAVNYYSYSKDFTAENNAEIILANNPHIDYRFGIGEFDFVFTDHDRCYTELVYDGDMWRSCDEPLVEQILRRFGFTEDDLKNIDSRPKLYFTQEEKDKCNSHIKNIVGDEPYGCVLFASRLEQYKGRWEKDYLLFDAAEKYKNTPIFYFSEFDLERTEWSKFFPKRCNFSELGLSVREQIYIKSKALFNIGYQAGVTDAASGCGSDVHSLCPHKSIRECMIRGVNYYYTSHYKNK
tara:strand:+ start:2335 stop:3294 length:960 start_codon:yes stop_codon:yes gene_type:complete